MVDQWKVLSLISSLDHSQRFLLSQTSDMLQAVFKPGQKLGLGFDEWSCTVVISSIIYHNFKLNFNINLDLLLIH